MSVPEIGFDQKEPERMAELETHKNRLIAHRWLLTAALGVLLLLILSGQLSLVPGLVSGSAMIVAALFAPVISRAERVAAVTGNPGTEIMDKHTRSLVEAFPDPVMIIGDAGGVLFANDESRKAFGTIEAGTPIALRFRDPGIQSLLRAALAGEAHSEVEYVETAPIEKWFAVTITEISNEQTDRRFVVHFRSLDDAKRTEKVRSDFIANASHELRTPLASLSGFIETLAGPARDDASARERFLKIMQEQAERMSRLIDDLLTLSRFETAHGKADFQPVDLGLVLHHVTDAMQMMAGQNDTKLTMKREPLPADEPLVFGNRDELIQLFENLVENAIKYGGEGGNVDIILGSSDSGKEFAVSVRDDGPGISQEHLPRLVERFYRVDVDTSRGKQGTGLGLSIVKHILQRHRGRLNVKSESGRGSEFTVTLPPPENIKPE